MWSKVMWGAAGGGAGGRRRGGAGGGGGGGGGAPGGWGWMENTKKIPLYPHLGANAEQRV